MQNEEIDNDETAESETFLVSIDGQEHGVGDESCTVGWCGHGYPLRCQCGGLIHADFGDENSDGDYWLWTKCDKCGGTGVER